MSDYTIESAKDVIPPAWSSRHKGSRSNWASLIKYVTNMTVAEAVEYFGEAARNLDSYKSDLTLRELLIFRAVVETLVDPSPAMLNLFMEREDGKVDTNVKGEININVLDWRALAEQKGLTEEEVLAEVKLLVEQTAQDVSRQAIQNQALPNQALPEAIDGTTIVDAALGEPKPEQQPAKSNSFRFERYRVEPKAAADNDSE